MSSHSSTFFHGVYFAYLRAHHSQLPSKSLEEKKKKRSRHILQLPGIANMTTNSQQEGEYRREPRNRDDHEALNKNLKSE
jgi:hypothetical protein